MSDLTPAFPRWLMPPAGHYGAEGDGVALTVLEPEAIASVAAARGQSGEVAARLAAAFGLTTPLTPRCEESGGVSLLGVAPGRWLAFGASAGLAARLESELGTTAAVCDQSDGYVLFDLSGARARDVLAKGVSLDLDPSLFAVGDAAATSIALISATFWRRGTDLYRLAVARSFAPDFARFLLSSAAEFGCDVAAPTTRRG